MSCAFRTCVVICQASQACLMLIPALWHAAGQVDTSRQASGFGAHPAVVDNCMQLGPVSGRLGLTGEESTPGTRVIGGIGAFLVAPAARGCPSAWAAAERAPAAADGTVCSSHWLTGAEGLRLQLQDLQVRFNLLRVLTDACLQRHQLQSLKLKDNNHSCNAQ